MLDIRREQLLYDARPGDHINKAVAKVVEGGYGGLVFNGLIVRRDNDETAEELHALYSRLCKERWKEYGR